MSDGKGDEKVSISSSCPPTAEDLTAPVERAKRMERRVGRAKRMGSSSRRRLTSADMKALEDARMKQIETERILVEHRMKYAKLASVQGPKRSESEERMRWIDELMSNSHLKDSSERVPMAVGEDDKLKGPLIHPFFHLDLGLLGLGDEDHHRDSTKLEAPIKLEGEDEDHHRESTNLEASIKLEGEDEDHHRESTKLEAPIKFEGEDEDHHRESVKLEVPMKTEGKENVCFVLFGDEVWESEEPKPKPPPRKTAEMEVGGKGLWRMIGAEEPEVEEIEPNDMPHWMTVSRYRIHWDERWSGYYGSFEDTTRIPPMRFTDKAKAALKALYVQNDTLQVYSVKLTATRGNLRLPLDVFGMVAVRDPVDHNRNIIFHRKRDECQTLTEKEPYLVLTGSTRAVMYSDARSNPSIIEVDLKVKGATESEDGCLSFLVSPLTCSGMLFSHVFSRGYTSKHSRLEFMLGHIVFSVEATIFVRVIDGSWPDGFNGLFTAATVFRDENATECSPIVGRERIILLDSRCQKVPVDGDGKIKLSRNVISTESIGKVIFQVKALEADVKVVEKYIIFHPLKTNKSTSELDIGFCKMEVTIFWSRVSCYP